MFWYVCRLWENLLSSSSGWLLLKNVKRISASVKAKLSKVGHFSSWDEVFIYGKYCSGYAGILSWTSRILLGRGEMKHVLPSYKCDNKFMKKLLQLSDLVNCPAPLVILSRLSYKQPPSAVIIKSVLVSLLFFPYTSSQQELPEKIHSKLRDILKRIFTSTHRSKRTKLLYLFQ